MQSYNLDIFGLELAFKTEADEQRVRKAQEFLEARYKKLATHGGYLGREKLLALLALGITDDLLQYQQHSNEIDERLNAIICCIDEV